MKAVLDSAIPYKLKLLAVTLADFGDDDGDRIYPSVERLADRLQVAGRTVQKQLRALETNGVIMPVTSKRGGMGQTVHYRLIIPASLARPSGDDKGRTPVHPFEETKGRTTVHPSEGTKGRTTGHQRANSETSKGEPRDVKGRTTVHPIRERSVIDPLVDPVHAHAAAAGGDSGTEVIARLPTYTRPDGREGFEAFWEAYPKKKGKEAAWRIWKRLQPEAELLATMIAALEWQRDQVDWVKDGGQYVPMPANWLKDSRWTDEPSAPTPIISDRTAMLDRAMKGFLSRE